MFPFLSLTSKLNTRKFEESEAEKDLPEARLPAGGPQELSPVFSEALSAFLMMLPGHETTGDKGFGWLQILAS